MVSQSPRSAQRLQRYEDGWELINRLIRADGTWSGRERNCVHLNCGDGTFADISAASGLDFIQDGRAISVLDLEGDGCPDLVLRNRNRPQIRVLKSQSPFSRRVLWLALEGSRSNRDAVGARVTVRTSRGVRVKEVRIGGAFLSQSSRRLYFALGEGERVSAVSVRWPGGRPQELGPIAPGRMWHVVEGEAPSSSPYAVAEATADGATDGAGDRTEEGGADELDEATETGLVEPLPAPDFSWPDHQGRLRRLESYTGRPLLLHFVSKECVVCRAELPRVASAARMIERAGGHLVLVSVDVALRRDEALSFLQGLRERVTALQATPDGLAALNIVQRQLFNVRRDLVVPTTFLINRRGAIEKVYRGRVSPSTLVADLKRLPLTTGERLKLALPFPGRFLRGGLRRDLLELGNAFFEAGLGAVARSVYSRALEANGEDLDVLYNYALTIAEVGDLREAAAIYQRILEIRPDFDDARNNMGILEARAGSLGAARTCFRKILDHNPAYSEATLNLAQTYLDEERTDAAASVYLDGLRHDPDSAIFLRKLGYVRHLQGDLEEAVELHERAMEIDPLDRHTLLNLSFLDGTRGRFEKALQVARRGLTAYPRDAGLLNASGMALRGLGRTNEATVQLRDAITVEPGFDGPYLNLARFYLEDGEKSRAREVLRELLAVVPDHEEAEKLLRRTEP